MAQCEGETLNLNELLSLGLITTPLQGSLIHFLKLAHSGIKGAAFLPGGLPATGADVGEELKVSTLYSVSTKKGSFSPYRKRSFCVKTL